MIRTLRTIARNLATLAGDYFAPYYVRCDLGTFQACWSLSAAHSWIAYCGPRAIITARYYGDEVIARRIQCAA